MILEKSHLPTVNIDKNNEYKDYPMTRKHPTLKDVIKETLPIELLKYVPRYYYTIGDIIVMKIPEELEGYKKQVGEAFIEAYP